MEEPPFPCPSGVNVADSVTINLCPTNYFAWKQLMLTFLESHRLSGFVDGTINPPNKPSLPRESPLPDQEDLWEEEKKRRFDWNQKHMPQREMERRSESWLIRSNMDEWVREGEGEESQEEQERRQEWDREREIRNEWCDESNRRQRERFWEYERWREEERTYTGWKRSDGLVRGWILVTVTDEILIRVVRLVTARQFWIKLEKTLTPPFQLSQLEFIDWTDQNRGQELSRYVVLHKAALTADWDTAAKFLGQEPDSVFQPITWCSETALIVAVRSADRNDFVKKLMAKMQRGSVALIAQQDMSGATALHAAVDGGNIVAAEWLVQMNWDLANIEDKYGTLAVHVAAGLGNREMVDFLLKHTRKLSETESGLN